MSSQDPTLRLKQLDIENKRRQVDQIERMIEDFEQMIGDLDHEIAEEHRRTRVYDVKHAAYSTLALAARRRRHKIETSIAELMCFLKSTEAALDLAQAEVTEDEEAAGDIGMRESHYAISPP